MWVERCEMRWEDDRYNILIHLSLYYYEYSSPWSSFMCGHAGTGARMLSDAGSTRKTIATCDSKHWPVLSKVFLQLLFISNDNVLYKMTTINIHYSNSQKPLIYHMHDFNIYFVRDMLSFDVFTKLKRSSL